MSPSKPRKVAVRMAAMLNGYLSERLSEEGLARGLVRLAKDLETDMAPRKVRDSEMDQRATAVFEHWQQRMQKPRAKLTANRRSKIVARLRDGYSVHALMGAVDGCACSEFHMGTNERNTEYNDITLICRNGEQVEKFIEMRTSQDPVASAPPEVRRLQRQAAEAMARGDVEAYNAANSELERMAS